MKTLILTISCVFLIGIIVVAYYVFSDKTLLNKLEDGQEYQIQNSDKFLCTNFVPGAQSAKKPTIVEESDLSKTYNVIVIGAGMAGIEAGHQLQRDGIDTLILEGRDRIGGRVYTDDMNGFTIDLGGSWIHGLNEHSRLENPLFKITQKNDIVVTKTHQSTTLYNYTGQKINDYSYDLIDKYYRFAESYDETLTDKQRQELSAQDVMDMFYAKTNLNENEKAIFEYTLQWDFDMEQAENTTNTSFAKTLTTQYYEDDEDNEVVFPHGYNQIVNCLADGLNIKHANVTAVDYGEPIIKVETNQGTFHSKYVISTLPIPVLQNKTGMGVKFTPELEQAKKYAIERLYMGTMDKVYLLYDESFWDSSAWINRIAKNDDDKKWQFFFNMHKYTGKPILLAFNTGESAKQIEKKSDDEIIKEVVSVLKTIYPNSPDPVDWRITRWASDPLAGGSYSIIPIDGSVDSAIELAKPIDNKLFLSGEATSAHYYGTVHGAYISGYRAAQQVLKVENDDLLDAPLEQIRHGIKKWDVVCKAGYEPIVDEIAKDNTRCKKTSS